MIQTVMGDSFPISWRQAKELHAKYQTAKERNRILHVVDAGVEKMLGYVKGHGYCLFLYD